MSRGNAGQVGPYRAPTSGVLRPRDLQQAPVPTTVLAVAGGASGSATGTFGPGGGCGGWDQRTLYLARGVAHPVSIGAGGLGVVNGAGNNGGDTTVATVTVKGGGKESTTGGSGGGAPAGSSSVGNATVGQGTSGGPGSSNAAGSGGGASQAGQPASSNVGGVGGMGASTFLTGTAIQFSGGGSGSGNGGPVAGPAVGGGGQSSASGNGSSGSAPGAGGGGGYTGFKGGDGYKGMAIIRVPSNFTVTFSAGVMSSLSTSVPGYNAYTVTATATANETFVIS